MEVLVSSEHRFLRTPDGAIWTPNVNSYRLWRRYLDVFDRVRVLARVCSVTGPDPRWIRADGDRVTFHAIPHFHGPEAYLRHFVSIRRAIASAMSQCEAVIMRVPSPLSLTMIRILAQRSHPFALECVGDPFDVFAPNASRHPLRAVFRRYFSAALRKQCMQAQAVAYVTAHSLQRRYPCRALMYENSNVDSAQQVYTANYSSIELSESQILPLDRVKILGRQSPTIVFVGSLGELNKGPEILIEAVARAVRSGFDLNLKIVGDGRCRGMLEDLVFDFGLENRCQFLGQLPGGRAVFDVLDSSDIFVLPSRGEGLPRAMIEAMARGLPCIGTTVGGIPELLAAEDLIEPGDVNALVNLLQAVVSDPERQKRMSDRNLAEARKYTDSELRKRRIEFYRQVEGMTACHLGRRQQKPDSSFQISLVEKA